MAIPRLSRRTRKLVLTVHVVSSVGWLGAALAMLVLVVATLLTRDAELRRASYLVMNLFDSALVLPIGALALLSGVVISLTTHWGVLKHYWVVIKLVLTVIVFALPLVLRSPQIDEAVARTATPEAEGASFGGDLIMPGVMSVLVLTVTTVLSTYKPWGRTPIGRRAAERSTPAARRATERRVTTG